MFCGGKDIDDDDKACQDCEDDETATISFEDDPSGDGDDNRNDDNGDDATTIGCDDKSVNNDDA